MNANKTVVDRIRELEQKVPKLEKLLDTSVPLGTKDPLLTQAIGVIQDYKKVSASFLQKKLVIGYARAARLLDDLEKEKYISPPHGTKPRKVLKI